MSITVFTWVPVYSGPASRPTVEIDYVAQQREAVRCPYCGHMAFEDEIERPVDYCRHDVVHLQ